LDKNTGSTLFGKRPLGRTFFYSNETAINQEHRPSCFPHIIF